MARTNFVLLVTVFVLFCGLVSAYTWDLADNCICYSCTDCTNALDDDQNCYLKVTLNQSISTNDQSCIQDPAHWVHDKILDLDGYTIYATNAQPQAGIVVADQGHIEIRNGEVADFHFFGIYLLNVTYATIHDITVTGNGAGGVGAGIYLGTDQESNLYNSYSTIYDCEVVDNDATGIMIQFADDNDIYRCDISRNLHGLWLDASSDNYVRDCFSDDNTGALGKGFSCSADHTLNHGSIDNTFRRINASGNIFGVAAENCVNGNFDDVILSDNLDGAVIAFTNDHLVTNPHAVTVQNSDIIGNDLGIWVDDSANNGVSGCVFEDNDITSNTYGIYLSNTYNNTIRRNDVSSGLIGIELLDSGLTSLPTNTVHGNSWYGLAIMNSSATSGTHNRFYNNNPDFWATANSRVISLELWYTIFSMPTGGMSSAYTNLTLRDILNPGYEYTINWTPARAVPANTFSFGSKFINISGSALSIDNATWHWSDSELSGFIESRLELWKYNGSAGWRVVNPTPDMGTNSISLLNFNPSSDYAILLNLSECPVITSPGSYQLAANLVGATNNVSEVMPGYFACVKIASSNVDFDCNGHSITSIDSPEIGVVLNGSQTNVTVRGCTIIGYHDGILVHDSDSNRFMKNTLVDNGQDNIRLFNSNRNNVTNNTATGSANSIWVDLSANNTVSGNRIYDGNRALYVKGSGDNIIANNSIYNNTGMGIHLHDASIKNSVYNNTVYASRYGVLIDEGSNNALLANNTLFNNTRYGLYIEDSTGTNATNTHSYNNLLADVFLNNSDGVTTRTVSFTNLTIDNPAGNFQNYTSLDMRDTFGASSIYSINWTANHYALPGTSASFRQKWVDINTVTGTVSIDTIIWRWLASEETGYTPAFFKLVKYNSSNQWQLMNGSPNTGARTLSLYSLAPGSQYGILQFVVNASILKLDQTIFQASPGGIVQFNITVNNTGNITLDSITVRDRLPAGLTVAGTYPSAACGATTCVWTLGPLSPGASRVLYLNASVDNGAAYSGNEIVNLTNYANVTAASNMSADLFFESYRNATIYYANISTIKTDVTALPPSPGGLVQYQITVTNIGNVTLDPVEVVDTLPTEFTYSNADPAPDDVSGDVLTWYDVGALAPGATTIILMNATVDSGTLDGVYYNNVDVTGTPPNGFDVEATDDVGVGVFVPAIDVVKVASDYLVNVGDVFTFNLTISNTGTINITVYAQDTLPLQLDYEVGEADPLPTAVIGKILYWDAIALLEPGQTFNITYNVTANTQYAGFQNNVSVTGIPPNGDNVTDTTSVSITASWPPDGGGEDLECITSVDCGDCEICSGHECVLEKGSCKTASDCEGTLTWVDDVLVPSDFFLCEECSCIPVDCIEDADCTGEGETCLENECVPPECMEDSDCPTGNTCQDYNCIPPECTDSSDCPEGYNCVNYQCQEEGGGEPPYGQGCTTDSDCPGSQYCSGGVCTNVPCECGYASAHTCVQYECCSDADCAAGESCESHVCEEKVVVPGEEGLGVDAPPTTEVGKPIVIDVTDENGNPVEGAQVTVIINGKAYSAGITDANGQVRFTPKEAGQYVVEASKPGFANGQDAFKASGALDMAQIATLVLAPLLLLGLLGALYLLFFAKKKKKKFKEDNSQD